MNDADRLELPHVAGLDEPEWVHEIREKGGYYDKSGNPISFADWMRLSAWDSSNNNKYKRIAEDTIGDYWVSTVWLGLDHGFGGPPLIFETMVFNKSYPKPVMPPPIFGMNIEEYFETDAYKKWSDEQPEYTSSTDLDCERYGTEEQAIAGHKAMVEKVRLIVAATEKGEEEDG